MNLQSLDWFIIFSCAFALIGGYRLGFVARAASWVGLMVGLFVAIKLLPSILHSTVTMSALTRLGIAVLLLVLGAVLGQILGLVAGARVSATLPPGPLRAGDRVVGAAFGGIGVLVFLWLMLPAAANVAGWPAQEVRTSVIARAIYRAAPAPPNTLAELRKLVGTNNFPPVFQGIDPAPDSGPPPASVSLPKEVVDRVSDNTVKVEGVACRRTQDGSGFAIGNNLIVTNAHVVAGESHTVVFTPNGDEYPATVVLYDPERDLALLRVPRYDEPGLPLASPQLDETGAVFGHPGGQDKLAIVPAVVRRDIVAVGRDLYDQQDTSRQVLILASELRQGDSGGALVNDRGEVIGVAFAIAPDRPGTSYALNTSELRAVLNVAHTSAVSTRACLND